MKIALHGFRTLYLGTLKHTVKGAKKFVFEETISTGYNVFKYYRNSPETYSPDFLSNIRTILPKGYSLVTTLDDDKTRQYFQGKEVFTGFYHRSPYGQSYEETYYISGINYHKVEGESCDNYDDLASVLNIDFVDNGLLPYYGFFSKLAGITSDSFKEYMYFVPGVKNHTLIRLKTKFTSPFKTFLINDLVQYTGVPINEVKESLENFSGESYVCSENDNFYWYELRDLKNMQSTINPYDVKQVSNMLIPKLYKLIDDGFLVLSKEAFEKIKGELAEFTYRSDMAYESLDSYPYIRSLMYIPFRLYNYLGNVRLKPSFFTFHGDTDYQRF